MAAWVQRRWRRLTHHEQGGAAEPRERVDEAERKVDESRELVDLNVLIDTLEDPDYSEARSAAKALGNAGDVQTVEALIRAVERTDLDLRREAATALGKIGSSEAVQPLIAALTDTRTHPERHAPLQISASNADARIEAAWALGEIGDPQAVDALQSVKHLQLRGLYRGCTLAQAAVEALAKLGAPADEAAAPPPDDRLIEALLSPLSSERERAIEAVETGGGARSDSLDRAYQASRKMKSAIESQGPTQQRLVEEAIEFAPTFSAAMGLLSNIYQYQDGSGSEALEWATKAVAANTNDWLAWIQLGRLCAHGKRDAVEATLAFSESVRLNPDVEGGILSEPYSYLLPVYEKLSMWEQATNAENRVRDGGTELSGSYQREWRASVATAPVEALRDALTGR